MQELQFEGIEPLEMNTIECPLILFLLCLLFVVVVFVHRRFSTTQMQTTVLYADSFEGGASFVARRPIPGGHSPTWLVEVKGHHLRKHFPFLLN